MKRSFDNVSLDWKQPQLSINVEFLDVERRISLCDIESISQTSPLLQELVENFITLHGVQIEECCLKTSSELYEKYGQIVAKLTLKCLPESDAHMRIGHFKCLTSFTMVNMNILEKRMRITMPSTLTELILIDCKFKKQWLAEWISCFGSYLKKLNLRNLEYSFSPYLDDDDLDLTSLNCLDSLTIEGQGLRISADGNQLNYLKIVSNDLIKFDFTEDAVVSCRLLDLQELHLDVPDDQLERFPFEFDTDHDYPLQRLTTRNLIPLDKLRALKKLEHLEVLSPVDFQFKDDIEAMNIKTVKVVYDPTSQPPEDTNLILKKLNDDCLLEIINRLKVHEWMSFGQVHPRVERILVDLYYPRAIITEGDIDKSKIAEDLPHFHRVAQRITKYECYKEMKHLSMLQRHLTALTSLTLRDVSLADFSIEVLPSRLEKLVLDTYYFQDSILTSYFDRLNSTLQVLEVFGRCSRPFNLQWLKPLRNLRELRIQYSNVFGDLSLILQNNATTLERFELDGFELLWAALANVLEPIKSMKKLKVLGITQTYKSAAVNFNLLEELLKIIGPQLKKLAVNCVHMEMQEVLKWEGLKYLQELHISVCEETIETAIASVATLKELQKLNIEFYHGRPIGITDTDLMILVKALPKLTAIKLPCFEADWTFGVEFNDYLKRENRTIKINGVKFPSG